MRSVLIVVGIAIVAVVLSMALHPSKRLSPAPQDDAAERKDAEIAAERAKAQKEGVLTAPSRTADFNPPEEGALTAVMSIEGRGDVTVKLYPKAAPQTVKHVADLIRSGFYDGLRFYRVVPGVLVQAGDPATRKLTAGQLAGMGDEQRKQAHIGDTGSGKTVPFEESNLPNIRGSLALYSKGEHSDTGDSQIYLNVKDNRTLDKTYCVFGWVSKGIDVLDKVQQGDAISRFAFAK